MRIKSNNLIIKFKKGLFKNKTDSSITIFLILIIIFFFSKIINWLVNIADWKVVLENLDLYGFGSYPHSEIWRPKLWITLLATLCFFTLFSSKQSFSRKGLTLSWILIIPFGIFLLAGGFGLAEIPTRSWGGLTLSLILTLCSAAIALPLGIILAIGRQSNLKLINLTCKLYIDLMRSFPLISVLFFGQLLIPLFLPVDYEVSRFIRAVFAFGLFSSAYIAEDIRGGLQTIPSTQYEAADVLGFNKRQTLLLIVLPQAIRTALPALTNQAIGLLQNTSLMAILGLVELLGISRSILANPEFIGRYLEVYVWLAALYWFICTVMALISRRIEHQLNL